MPRSSRRKGKGPKKGSQGGTVIRGAAAAQKPGSDAMTVYRGPVHPPGWLSQHTVVAKELKYAVTATSSAGGVINPVFDQTMSNLTNWANWAGIFDEFRVLKMVLEYAPISIFEKALATTSTPGYVVIDRDSNGALAVATTALSYESTRMYSLDLPWMDRSSIRGWSAPPPTWSMESVNDATWLTTSSPTPTIKPCIKLFFGSNSVSTNFGVFLLRVLVQFRGQF